MRIPVDKTRVSVKHGLKMCGLCSEKSDSFVDLTMELRVFLRTFLSPPNPEYDLPYKLCLKCYKTTSDAKGFKDKSNGAMMKLVKEGRRDLYSKDRRRPKIIIDWKDKHMAEKTINRMARAERQESEEEVAMVIDAAPEKNKPSATNEENHLAKDKFKAPGHDVEITLDAVSKEEKIEDSKVGREIAEVKDIQQEINNQFSDAMEVIENIVSKDDENLIKEEENFPATGPYQCELCDVICETKEEFLNDIKTKHVQEIDGEVLDALEKDIKIRAAKRRAGIVCQ